MYSQSPGNGVYVYKENQVKDTKKKIIKIIIIRIIKMKKKSVKKSIRKMHGTERKYDWHVQMSWESLIDDLMIHTIFHMADDRSTNFLQWHTQWVSMIGQSLFFGIQHVQYGMVHQLIHLVYMNWALSNAFTIWALLSSFMNDGTWSNDALHKNRFPRTSPTVWALVYWQIMTTFFIFLFLFHCCISCVIFFSSIFK